jgi:hypothetical protein
MCKNCAIALAIVAVGVLGGSYWMFKHRPAPAPAPAPAPGPAPGPEPAPAARPYGCGSYMRDCVPGDVGGCEQYKQTCASADNSVRMSMARPGECDQFRRQCAQGSYTSCDLYNRGCLYEEN